MAAHAKLSASGAKRWMSCTPSVAFESQYPNDTSTYAEEGTFAHELSELILNYNLNNITKRAFNKKYKELQTNQYYSQELMDYVEGYVNNVMEFVYTARSKCKDAVVLLEQRLDFSTWVPEGFGTGDVVIIADGELHIIDLKYGKGVPVVAEDNPQLRLYGLGALSEFELLYDIETVKMSIIQPRLDLLTSSELVVEDLLEWAETQVKPKAALAMDGQGDFVAGDHCKFCRGKATCRARAEKNLELTKFEFAKPDALMGEEIGEILKVAGQLSDWIKDVQAYALDQAENHGKKFDGWKLVEGRSNRKYVDEIQVANALKGMGYEEAIIYEKSLLGITAMEKAIGKKAFAEALGELIIKPSGKPTLVVESDKRPELNTANSAKADFEEDMLS